MNGWDVQPNLDGALALSSVRIVCNRLITTPGHDPASPVAHLRASTVQAGQPSRSTRQPATRDLAVAQPETVLINRLIRSPETVGDTPL